jgi:hypothetical protein
VKKANSKMERVGGSKLTVQKMMKAVEPMKKIFMSVL